MLSASSPSSGWQLDPITLIDGVALAFAFCIIVNAVVNRRKLANPTTFSRSLLMISLLIVGLDLGVFLTYGIFDPWYILFTSALAYEHFIRTYNQKRRVLEGVPDEH